MDLEDDPNDNETSEEEITCSTDEDEIIFDVIIVLYFEVKCVYSVLVMSYLELDLYLLFFVEKRSIVY